MSILEDMVERPRSVRWLKVITGVRGRRRWTDAERGRLLAEATGPSTVVSVIGRRHGLSPQHLFTRLPTARRAAASLPVTLPLAFVAALVGESGTDPVPRRSRPLASQRFALAAEIELDMAGVTVRIGESARE